MSRAMTIDRIESDHMDQPTWNTDLANKARGVVQERRATSRYNLALPVTIRVAPNLAAVGPILVETRDISTNGFYFNIAEQFTTGTRFEFSIALPIEITGAIRASISGNARAVRVVETGKSHDGHSGVGALIESYQQSTEQSP
jgi:hypothetical protein